MGIVRVQWKNYCTPRRAMERFPVHFWKIELFLISGDHNQPIKRPNLMRRYIITDLSGSLPKSGPISLKLGTPKGFRTQLIKIENFFKIFSFRFPRSSLVWTGSFFIHFKAEILQYLGLSCIKTKYTSKKFCPAKRPQERWGKKFIQISAVAKVVAKEALAQPISAWPCIRNLNLPPKKRVPFCFQWKRLRCPSVIYNLYSFFCITAENCSIAS